MKTILSSSIVVAALLTGVAHAENLRAITVDATASYALDTDSIVQSNGRTAYTVQAIYTNKMQAPNGSDFLKGNSTMLTDCKAQTQAVTGVTLTDGAGKVVYTFTPTPAEAPMITPEKASIDAKIMQTVCSLKK